MAAASSSRPKSSCSAPAVMTPAPVAARQVVFERLGHATVTITLEIYAYVMPGMQSEAAARFAALVGGQL